MDPVRAVWVWIHVFIALPLCFHNSHVLKCLVSQGVLTSQPRSTMTAEICCCSLCRLSLAQPWTRTHMLYAYTCGQLYTWINITLCPVKGCNGICRVLMRCICCIKMTQRGRNINTLSLSVTFCVSLSFTSVCAAWRSESRWVQRFAPIKCSHIIYICLFTLYLRSTSWAFPEKTVFLCWIVSSNKETVNNNFSCAWTENAIKIRSLWKCPYFWVNLQATSCCASTVGYDPRYEVTEPLLRGLKTTNSGGSSKNSNRNKITSKRLAFKISLSQQYKSICGKMYLKNQSKSTC